MSKSIFKKKEIGRMFMRGDERFVIVIGENNSLIFDSLGSGGIEDEPEPIETHDTREYINWDYEIFDLDVGSPRMIEQCSRENFPGMIGSVFLMNDYAPNAISIIVSDKVVVHTSPGNTFSTFQTNEVLTDYHFDEMEFTKMS